MSKNCSRCGKPKGRGKHYVTCSVASSTIRYEIRTCEKCGELLSTALIEWVKEAQGPSFLNRVFKKTRIIVTWGGKVDITYSNDGMYHERIRIGEDDFLYGIWSVIEHLNGKSVGIAIEELRD